MMPIAKKNPSIAIFTLFRRPLFFLLRSTLQKFHQTIPTFDVQTDFNVRRVETRSCIIFVAPQKWLAHNHKTFSAKPERKIASQAVSPPPTTATRFFAIKSRRM